MIQFKKKNNSIEKVDYCNKNLNFLGHAQIEQIDVGSICGGHGHCGKDKIRFKKEDLVYISEPSVEEKAHLTKEEIDKGYRLSCQVFPEDCNRDFIVETVT
ncbi:MAG: 2Fe-2S iron-sulfur cluster-binding protein [Bacteriovoracia bacterium]